MEVFNKKILWDYKPSIEVYQLALLVSEKLGKLNVRLSTVFVDHKKASRIFAFIESKYSSKIEGIYTTLFDVVNTGKITNQQKLIQPLVDELFKSRKILSVEKLNEISAILNTGNNEEKRWDKKNFGIYETQNNKAKLIYQPPMEKEEVNNLLKEVIKKSQSDKNIIQILHTHILFEKIHPYVDANGRLGRLILQKGIAEIINFSNVLPVSWAIFKNKIDYYDAFSASSNKDIDNGIKKLLKIILKMYEATKQFTIALDKFVKNNVNLIKSGSKKITHELWMDILLSLQTRRTYIERIYNLNPRTIDSFFEKINSDLPFNRKMVSNNTLYWNIELEEIIDKYFN